MNMMISYQELVRTFLRTFATVSGGTWGITSASPTGVSLSFAISSDGKTLTVTLTAIDSASRVISAKLRA
ncbi:hypothetical protein FMJ12_10240 [Klebsiella pneumoniae]|nr:hypothetical protein [Klebsiella pneumoniae]